MEASPSFAFGPFVFHTLSRRLDRQGELVLLNSRATELLLVLLRRAGELVTKDDLLHAAWGSRIVAENNLTVHMATLRRVLRRGGEADNYIRTEHGRGYRFIAPVEVAPTDGYSVPGALTAHPRHSNGGQIRGGTDWRGISILVPPVQSLLNSEASRSLAVEITRDLMVQLARVPSVLVIGSGESRYALRISVRPGKGTAQIVAMVDDAIGATVWADRFEHRHVGSGPMESEISSRLTNAVITELLDREASLALPQEAPPGADAQHCAVRGWSALNRELSVPQDIAEARLWFDRALLDDPTNASALAGSAYAIVADNIRMTTQHRDALASAAMRAELRHADELATRAVARAPDWPRAWFCRGYVRQWQQRFDAALTAYERALSLNPCDAESLAYAGHIHFLSGRIEEMRAPLQRALALGPRDRGVGLWHHFLGQYDFTQGRDELAIPYFVRGADLCPSLVYPVAFLASALAHGGRIEEGRRTLDAWCEAMGGFRVTIDQLRARVFSDNAIYLGCHERLYRGLRLIGIPER
ncbi:winged helix-turn-helix domain-containing protein [Reyranella sp.]|uniref:winged helix-turn-helix domain-containing protein n=1 Tax=Reyranella sp. TaxID=1929291 RepID=UPI003D13FA04